MLSNSIVIISCIVLYCIVSGVSNCTSTRGGGLLKKVLYGEATVVAMLPSSNSNSII